VQVAQTDEISLSDHHLEYDQRYRTISKLCERKITPYAQLQPASISDGFIALLDLTDGEVARSRITIGWMFMFARPSSKCLVDLTCMQI
jgi:hypothetical protein